MAEYVAKLLAGTDDKRSDDLVGLQTDHHENLNAAAARTGEVRIADPAEASAVADVIAGLRDALGLSDAVTYHECRHDEGIGACTPEVR